MNVLYFVPAINKLYDKQGESPFNEHRSFGVDCCKAPN